MGVGRRRGQGAQGFCAVSRPLPQRLDVLTNHPHFRVLCGGFVFMGMIKSLATGDWPRVSSPSSFPGCESVWGGGLSSNPLIGLSFNRSPS